MKRLAIQRLGQLIMLSLIIVISFLSTQAKRNDDVVILKNGDRLTGEIKGLQRGELKFKAGYMAEAVDLDWTRVERLESKDKFLIFLTDGKLLTDFVRLVSASDPAAENFVIGDRKNAIRVRPNNVVKITPVEKGFWTQLEGTIDFGLGYTSGNNQYQTELTASATYRRGDHSITTSVDTAFSGQPKGSSTAREEFTVDYRKQLSPRWFAGGLFDLLSSDQQSLDLRTTLGGFIGRNLKQTDQTRISILGGLAGTREKYSATVNQSRKVNADAIAGLDFTTFRFKTTDISSRFLVYPSLTIPGRIRMQSTTDLRIEIVKDLYWGFHLYENYDPKPPVRANKNDLGISSSIGWKF